MQKTDVGESSFLNKLEGTLNTAIDFDFKPDNVCIICSNKSIVAGYLISDYANECCNVPTTVTDDVRIPGWFNENTLVILIIDMENKNRLFKLMEKLNKCNIVTLTDFDASDFNDTILNIKIESKTNYEYLGEILGYLFLLFDKMKMISKSDVMNILPMLKKRYDKAKNTISSTNIDEFSKKNILIAYPPNLRSTALLWKFTSYTRLKQPTLTTEYPEFDHNEIVGWCMSPNQSKNYVVFFIMNDSVSELLNVITESLVEVLEDSEIDIRKIKIDGRNNLEKNLIGFTIGEAIPIQSDSQ